MFTPYIWAFLLVFFFITLVITGKYASGIFDNTLNKATDTCINSCPENPETQGCIRLCKESVGDFSSLLDNIPLIGFFANMNLVLIILTSLILALIGFFSGWGYVIIKRKMRSDIL